MTSIQRKTLAIAMALLTTTAAAGTLTTLVPQISTTVGAIETQGFYEYRIDQWTNTATITKYTGDELYCKIPSKLGGVPVRCLGSSAFSGKKFMQKVSIPSTVQKIESYCFMDSTGLLSVTIPNGVTELGNDVFSGCTALQKVKIGTGIKELRADTFENCAALTSVTLPESLVSIGNEAFRRCTALQKITLPKKLQEIKYNAFGGCSALQEITIPDSVTSMGSFVFTECTALKRIAFGTGVKAIPEYTCDDCVALQSVTFPKNSAVSIGRGAFEGCKSLETFETPDTLESIAYRAFSGDSSLKTIQLNEGLATIDNAFSGCTALEEITIPSTVLSVDTYAFYGCNNLKTIHWLANYKTGRETPGSRGNSQTPLAIYCYENSMYLPDLQKTKNAEIHLLETKPSQSIKLSKSQVVLFEGQTANIKAALSPEGSTDSIWFQSSNDKIARVNQLGKIEALGYGSAVITAQTNSGKVAQTNVIVQKAPTKLALSKSSVAITKGKATRLKALVDDGSRTDVKVTWSSSNTKVATVSASGKVTAKGKGTAKIYAKTYNGLKAACKITVK